MAKEYVTLGGGCFWCLEPIFELLDGVNKVTVGYAGGQTENPNYERVCSGKTGHAEVVQIEFDSDKINYREILTVFFQVHDPTTLNRQGADVGAQYRSIILTHNEDQMRVAKEVVQEVNQSGDWKDPVVTEIIPLDRFYEGEEYHQAYYQKNPWAGYCQVVIRPKVEKFIKNKG